MTDAAELVALFEAVAAAVAGAVADLGTERRRNRTGRPGQYELDLHADAAALELLHQAPVRVVSEESGISGEPDAPVTVVVDPVDGSTNCARGIPYWSVALCALDDRGPLVGLVANPSSGSTIVAERGAGARRDGVPLRSGSATRVEDAVVALAGPPGRWLPWKQFRALGCASLALCDVAAGGLDGYVDGGAHHAPWDYLAAALVCTEAGAVVRDVAGLPLATTDPSARRQLLAAGTGELLDALRPAAGSP